MRLWWRSTISMSELEPRMEAAFLTSSSRTLMPRDILALRKTGMVFAASSICASCSGLKPVVAMTMGMRRSTQKGSR